MYFTYKFFVSCVYCEYFPAGGCPFIFLKCLSKGRSFNFDEVQFIRFSLFSPECFAQTMVTKIFSYVFLLYSFSFYGQFYVWCGGEDSFLVPCGYQFVAAQFVGKAILIPTELFWYFGQKNQLTIRLYICFWPLLCFIVYSSVLTPLLYFVEEFCTYVFLSDILLQFSFIVFVWFFY